MFVLSERCKALRGDAVNEKNFAAKICAQHAFWSKWGKVTLDPSKYSNITLSAAGTASVMRNAAPVIADGELIVGYNFGDGAHSGLTGDRGRDTEIFRRNGFTDEQIAWYYNPDNQVKGYTRLPPTENLTEKEHQLRAELTAINSAGNSSITANHSVIGYEKVLRLGFSGLLEEVNRYAGINGESDYYTALRMICEAGCVLGENYAAEARRIGRNDIAEVCRQVPAYGARSFREAVQSLWFAHIVNTWEDDINANSLGRLDQILYPYYRHDIDSGVLTEEDAFELLCCLWIKLYRDYDVQQSCVGGRAPDGSSQVNDLSYLMLDVTEALNFVRCLSVRFDSSTDKAFLRRALEVVGRVRKGIPFFFNDDVMIPALTAAGISYEDACGYTQIGCVETVIPGKSNPHAVNSRSNLLKAVEYALADGYSMFDTKLRPGAETGNPLTFENFDMLMEAVKAQIKHIMRATVNVAVSFMPNSEVNDPKPVKSLLTEGCTERGIDFNARGALYDYYQVMLMGIPNLADSLAAVKTLVYDKRHCSMEELLYQLKNNWPDEKLRLDFVSRAPKFGNDIEEVDNIAAELTEYSCDCLADESQRTGYSFHAQPFTFLWMIDHGRVTAATPDGRRRGEIIAYSVSPMQGRDREGLTALMKSLSRLPTKKTPGTTSAIVEVDPKLFEEDTIDRIVELMLGAAALGLSNVQFNTVCADTLLDAQLHPENYRNLAVRVSGFSQKFNLLSRELQDHIIARTKHAE